MQLAKGLNSISQAIGQASSTKSLGYIGILGSLHKLRYKFWESRGARGKSWFKWAVLEKVTICNEQQIENTMSTWRDMQRSQGKIWPLHNAYLLDQVVTKLKLLSNQTVHNAGPSLATDLYKCGDTRGMRGQKVGEKLMTL